MAGKCIKFLIAMMFSALTIAAIVFSILTVASCDYVTYLDDQGQTKMAGLFKFEVPGEGMEGECVTYTESEVDSLTNLEKTAMVRTSDLCGYCCCVILFDHKVSIYSNSYACIHYSVILHLPKKGMRLPGTVLRHRRPGLGDPGTVFVRQMLHRSVRVHPVFLRDHRPIPHVHVP